MAPKRSVGDQSEHLERDAHERRQKQRLKDKKRKKEQEIGEDEQRRQVNQNGVCAAPSQSERVVSEATTTTRADRAQPGRQEAAAAAEQLEAQAERGLALAGQADEAPNVSLAASTTTTTTTTNNNNSNTSTAAAADTSPWRHEHLLAAAAAAAAASGWPASLQAQHQRYPMAAAAAAALALSQFANLGALAEAFDWRPQQQQQQQATLCLRAAKTPPGQHAPAPPVQSAPGGAERPQQAQQVPCGAPTLQQRPAVGPARRRRRGARKCRKTYGMGQRQLWCTQCKWKKACTRFNQQQASLHPSGRARNQLRARRCAAAAPTQLNLQLAAHHLASLAA